MQQRRGVRPYTRALYIREVFILPNPRQFPAALIYMRSTILLLEGPLPQIQSLGERNIDFNWQKELASSLSASVELQFIDSHLDRLQQNQENQC